MSNSDGLNALKSYITKSHTEYTKHMRKYIKWHVKYANKDLIEFIKKLKDRISTNENSLVSVFITEQDLRKIIDAYYGKNAKDNHKKIETVVVIMMKRLIKHLKHSNKLLFKVWKGISLEYIKNFDTFVDIIKKCYAVKTNKTYIHIDRENVLNIFQNVLNENIKNNKFNILDDGSSIGNSSDISGTTATTKVSNKTGKYSNNSSQKLSVQSNKKKSKNPFLM
mmetsp:Transcript_40088/g.49491  ORF Transcript_40088/g.49491 Transcript_40088/m.49491 type:complete len:223 (-) Transcript_40088:73-741(-)